MLDRRRTMGSHKKSPTFGGLYLPSGPLYYDGSKYAISESWINSSYRIAYGKTAGSTYFDMNNLAELFEGITDTSWSGSNIDNLLNPLNGWRLPSREDWYLLTNTRREGNTLRAGSTVNGTPNVTWASIVCTDFVSNAYSGNRNNICMLFPDDMVIEGKSLSAYNHCAYNSASKGSTRMTMSEIYSYIAQGCCCFLSNGYYFSNTSRWNAYNGYWSSTCSSGLAFYEADPSENGVSCENTANGYNICLTTYLVKDA